VPLSARKTASAHTDNAIPGAIEQEKALLSRARRRRALPGESGQERKKKEKKVEQRDDDDDEDDEEEEEEQDDDDDDNGKEEDPEEDEEETQREEGNEDDLLVAVPEQILGEGKGAGPWKGKKVFKIRWSDGSIEWDKIDTFMLPSSKKLDPAYDELFNDWSDEKIRIAANKRNKRKKRKIRK
jgi:hypothetical protein